jgi:stage III sporulation protein SpoIIIAA
MVHNTYSNNCTTIKDISFINIRYSYMVWPTLAMFREVVNEGQSNGQLCYRFAVVTQLWYDG